jgi:hypothetical protein
MLDTKSAVDSGLGSGLQSTVDLEAQTVDLGKPALVVLVVDDAGIFIHIYIYIYICIYICV